MSVVHICVIFLSLCTVEDSLMLCLNVLISLVEFKSVSYF